MIHIALATLQSLVDNHVGISYKEAIEEVRTYITGHPDAMTKTCCESARKTMDRLYLKPSMSGYIKECPICGSKL